MGYEFAASGKFESNSSTTNLYPTGWRRELVVEIRQRVGFGNLTRLSTLEALAAPLMLPSNQSTQHRPDLGHPAPPMGLWAPIKLGPVVPVSRRIPAGTYPSMSRYRPIRSLSQQPAAPGAVQWLARRF